MEAKPVKIEPRSQPQAAEIASAAVLLTPAELAARLSVRQRHGVREKCRQRARMRDSDPLPVVPLGKYTRFRMKLSSLKPATYLVYDPTEAKFVEPFGKSA